MSVATNYYNELLNNDELLEIEREYCSRRLVNFVERAWPIIEPGTEFLNGWCIGAVCEHYQAITEGQITRLLVTIPTGISKSTISQVMFPPWEWGPRRLPHLRIIGASFEVQNAMRDNRKTRLIIESDWYQKLWPLKLTTDHSTKGYFENEYRGFRQCCAVDSMTGKRGDRVNWDDPISAKEGMSQVALKNAAFTCSRVLPTRLNNQKTSSISIIMQRIAKNDVADLAKELGYVHLMLPMEYEPKRKCFTIIGFEDPRTEENELLFPELYPREAVDELKISLGRDGYDAQMQQRPNPEGGGIIKTADFKYYSGQKALPIGLRYREIYADTAMKTKDYNDFSVLQCWGLSQDGKMYLVDQIRGKWEAPELERRTIAFWAKHAAYDVRTHGPLRCLCIEDKASGTGLLQSIKEKGHIPLFPIQVEKDRMLRVTDALPTIEAGMIYLDKEAPYLIDFLDECESFTATDMHPHDDQIDPMVNAIARMLLQNTTPWWQTVIKNT